MVRSQLIESFIQHIGTVFRSAKHSLQLPADVPDLGYAEVGTLFRLCSVTDGMSTSDLANQLGVTNSAATQLVDKLVEKGMITRERDTDDRRSVRLSLTEKANQSLVAIRKSHAKQLQPFFDDLSTEELEQLVTLACKIKIKDK